MALDPVAERSVRIVVIHGLGVRERARVRRFGGAVHGELLNRVNRLAIGLNAFEGVGACDRLNKESHGLIHIKRDHGRGNSHSENARSDRKTEHLGGRESSAKGPGVPKALPPHTTHNRVKRSAPWGWGYKQSAIRGLGPCPPSSPFFAGPAWGVEPVQVQGPCSLQAARRQTWGLGPGVVCALRFALCAAGCGPRAAGP
jgi:hypothetical protein